VPADCDNSFLAETLDFFNTKWNLLTNRTSLSGISVLCFDLRTKLPIGDLYPSDDFVTNNLELAFNVRPKIKGEKWGCIRVELLTNIIFPKVKGAYFPEPYLWFSLAKKYNVVCFNKVLRAYYIEPTSVTNLENKRDANKINKFKIYNTWLISNFGFYLLPYSLTKLLNSSLFILKAYLVSTAKYLNIIKGVTL
jgi:hypothetical protein